MNPGDSVIAIAFGNKKIRRVFVQQIENTMVICNRKEWISAVAERRQPRGVGFPFYSVRPVKLQKSI